MKKILEPVQNLLPQIFYLAPLRGRGGYFVQMTRRNFLQICNYLEKFLRSQMCQKSREMRQKQVLYHAKILNRFLVVFAAIFSFFSFSAVAGGIGILDVEKIVKESSAMRDIQAKISKKQDEYQKEVTKKQDDLEAEQKRIESKKNVLSKEAFEKETKSFEKKIDDLKTFVDRKQNSLKKASMDAMSKVNDKIKDIIADVSKEKELEVIVPASQTLYYKDDLDISEEILKRLNKKITKVDVKFEG